MSASRIDHTGSAIANLDALLKGEPGYPDAALVVATISQVHATLALVEQQRIANTIALGSPQTLIGGGEASVPSWDAQYQLRPEIAEALGLS
jgi:hypothetical protein